MIQKNITPLPKTIKGKGSMSGYILKQILETTVGYCYEAIIGDTEKVSHYEAFLKKSVPVCIDFENRIYSETEFKEKYPKDEDFGVWAWATNDLESAINKITSLT